MNYTDEQLKRLAECLGIKTGCGNSGALLYMPTFPSAYNAVALVYWLLSPEGQTLIEKMFADMPVSEMRPLFIKGGPAGYNIFSVDGGDMCSIYTDGDTPAEAWLDAGVKFTEGI